jgi:UDP-N-acetylglucosamine--N-acetylmuramyl-(pentapeptide) pyrophosphoryl-undecaprenol N-acetylglucosamine transferase
VNIILAGGGTGGHVYPALAIAEALRRRDPAARALFVGSRAGMEATLVPSAGIPFVGLPVCPPRSRAPLRVLRALAGAGASLGQATVVLARFRPDAIIATGGIAAVPSVMVAAALHMPILVLEGNAVPGRANRFLARFSRAVAVSSEEAGASLPGGRIVVTGLPVRREVYSATREEGLRSFGLDPARRTVLVIGGSQGAARLNAAVADAAAHLSGRLDVQVIHQVGRGWDGALPDRSAPQRLDRIAYVRVPYLERIGEAYACADLVVSRCGANALAEITACGLPAILVPYPHAADDHQARNAAALVAGGAAVLLPDAALSGDALAKEIAALLDDPERLRTMALAARRWGRRDAADRVVALLASFAEAAPTKACG